MTSLAEENTLEEPTEAEDSTRIGMRSTDLHMKTDQEKSSEVNEEATEEGTEEADQSTTETQKKRDKEADTEEEQSSGEEATSVEERRAGTCDLRWMWKEPTLAAEELAIEAEGTKWREAASEDFKETTEAEVR